jgi:3-hydroxyisobutyrate dehydrogenase-like beta-hydroxyacid dehydrogenase
MRVAWLGLGIMGSRQAANLVRAGHELTVWNRTRETAEAWAREHRATVAGSPGEAVAEAEVAFSMLVDGPQVRTVLGEAAGAAPPDLLCVDMSTIGAAEARSIGAALADRGVAFMDAPVTGSSPKAEDGTLTIMAGGDRADFERARPLFESMGQLIVHAGPLGHGQTVKVINNAVAAANASTAGQALIAADAAGVNLDALVEVMGAGSGGSAMLALKSGPMRAHDYATLFKLEHMLKDVRLCLEEAEAAGVPFPAASSARDVLAAGIGRDLGDADFAAMIEVLEGYAGRRL